MYRRKPDGTVDADFTDPVRRPHRASYSEQSATQLGFGMNRLPIPEKEVIPIEL